MNNNIIELKNVSKSYDIRGMGYRTFREKISSSFGLSKKRDEGSNILWALKDVSFGVGVGEAIGIIGANGSGKTTILRLLAGVSSQTSGEIKIDGKIAPLIQVGAGFHPELTGRENIYLNGIILGLNKKEIDGKFDEIVRFAELERFIDTPVKKYSSGMYVRLGFSVAIHVDADILLIDEILSVGDLSFQRKCLDMMSKIRREKKTIVFVSHNLSAVRGLCDRVIWLDHGKLMSSGDPEECISAYTQYMEKKTEFIHDCNYVGQKTRWGTGEVTFKKVTIQDSKGDDSDAFLVGDEMRVRLEFEAIKKIVSPILWVGIVDENENKVAGSYYNKQRVGDYELKGNGIIECTFENLLMSPGTYYLMVGIYDEHNVIAYDRIGRAHTFRIEYDHGSRFEKYHTYGAPSIVCLANRWERRK